jgi:hypothetical protein
MTRITKILFLLLIAGILLALGCAAGSNPDMGTPTDGGSIAGFWLGLWHGFILFFTFIISLFNHNVGVYEVHNSGWAYNLGYLLGVMIFFGGSGSSSRKCRKTVIVETAG